MPKRFTVEVSLSQSSPWKPIASGTEAVARAAFTKAKAKLSATAAVRLLVDGAPLMLSFGGAVKVKRVKR